MPLNLGLVVILISALGYISNRLNWRFLNYKIVHLLYYLGALIHESSHALLCLLTGAKILEFKVLDEQPRVIHEKPKLPIIGNLLISSAPILGGLAFLFFINKFAFSGYFTLPHSVDWQNLLTDASKLLNQINLTQRPSWVMILLLLNAGAMIGPSFQDLKNIWPLLIVLLFIQSRFFASLGLLAVMLILANIVIQIILATAFKILKTFGIVVE